MQINVVTIISTLMSVLMGINARLIPISNWETCSHNLFINGGWTKVGLFSGGDGNGAVATADGLNTLRILYSATGVIHIHNEGAIPFQYYIQDQTAGQYRWLMHAIGANVRHVVYVQSAEVWARVPPAISPSS